MLDAKKSLILMSLIAPIVLGAPAKAGRVEPSPISCYFFRDGQLELQQTCIYESYSWAGGGMRSLLWEDGVRTTMAWGLQGRGERPCEDTSVDQVCGSTYFRHPTTLDRISDSEAERLQRNGSVVRCVQVQTNSVCWY
jgi:hypothetical protein